MASTMKDAAKNAVSKADGKATDKLEVAAKELKDKVVPIFTPAQVIGQFEANLDRETVKKLTPLYDALLDEFASEANSRIEIGSTLVKIRELLGENFRKFLETCVVGVLRKSIATCYSYIGLAQAFNLKFAKNKVVKTALSRIWGAEGCFDTENGELKSAVDEAIGASGGIPESTDSLICETWARKFVANVDKLVKGSRQAEPGGRKWDVATMDKKHGLVVKAFRSFITNKSVSTVRATKLLTAILVESMVEMSATNIQQAMKDATVQIHERKLAVKNAHEETQEQVSA